MMADLIVSAQDLTVLHSISVQAVLQMRHATVYNASERMP